MSRFRGTVGAASVVAALVGAGAGVATYAVLAEGDTTTVVREVATAAADGDDAIAQTSLSVAEIFRRSHEGVVEITTSGASASPFDGGGQPQAQGSGFVIDEQGHIVTNHHVVDGAGSVQVTFWNGASYGAEIVGSDASTDLAVVRVDAPASLLVPLRLADSSALEVGDSVVAIGAPFGLEETVTSGIVSALDREISSQNGFTIDDAIQTDAAINHGNSGGPLLNLRGRVVGVNAQIESESGGNDGVGFAVPSNTVRSIVAQLLEDGSVEHAYLGVSIQIIPSSAADELGTAAGAAIATIQEGTPAADAGLRAASGSQTVDGQTYPTGGDVITKIDGETVRSAADLRSLIDAKQPGDTVRITYVRDGATKTVSVTLGTRPS